MYRNIVTILIIITVIATIIISGIVIAIQSYHAYQTKPDLRPYMKIRYGLLQWIQCWILIIPIVLGIFTIYGLATYFKLLN